VWWLKYWEYVVFFFFPGLEYLVELVPDERGKEPMYVCMLCDKKGDPRIAMAHLNSFNHRCKYIVSLPCSIIIELYTAVFIL